MLLQALHKSESNLVGIEIVKLCKLDIVAWLSLDFDGWVPFAAATMVSYQV